MSAVRVRRQDVMALTTASADALGRLANHHGSVARGRVPGLTVRSLALLRAQLGLTQRELAAHFPRYDGRAALRQATLADIESGASGPWRGFARAYLLALDAAVRERAMIQSLQKRGAA